jgi:hypothetical protein
LPPQSQPPQWLLGPALASPPDDRELLALEEQFFEQQELATAHDDEMEQLAAIWQAESERLYHATLQPDGSCSLTRDERWNLVRQMPEAQEHDRLDLLQEAHYVKMGALVKEMWAIPALTPKGRMAKVVVALNLLPSNWRVVDEDADYGIRETRQLLIDLIGGGPGEQLRDQFR